jgi:hypothetical protein
MATTYNGFVLVGFLVFNATFNNISVISWQSVLLVEETNITQYVLDTTLHKQTHIMQIRHGPSYKQLEVKTNRTPF